MPDEGSFLYPRLDRETSLALYRHRLALSLGELEVLGALGHPDAAPAPSGGHPVEEGLLNKIQHDIREVAVRAGYPAALNRSRAQEFDRSSGTILFRSMGIVTADAADEGVWSFMSLVLTPEIGPWRFPKRAEDRLLGKPRNVFRRVWWRSWALGEQLDFAPDGCDPLGEDEFVQIMERPSLGGNPRVASALRDALWRAELAGLSIARSDMMRELTRRLRAVRSHIALEVLGDDQLTAILDGLINDGHLHLCQKPLKVKPLPIQVSEPEPESEGEISFHVPEPEAEGEIELQPKVRDDTRYVAPTASAAKPQEPPDNSIEGLIAVFQARHSLVSKSEIRDLGQALPGWLKIYRPSTIRTAIGKSSTLGGIEDAAIRIEIRLDEIRADKRNIEAG